MVQENITLKQVISKIEKMDSSHKFEWTYSILKSFGNEFISHIFKEAYEQGKFDEAIQYSTPKVEIPSHISDWIVYCKNNQFTLLGALSPVGHFGEPLANSFKGDVLKCAKWAKANSNIFADAWVNGYKVKKEKYYYVAIPVELGRYRRLGVLASGRVCLLDHNYESIELLKKHSEQSTGKLTEQMIKESELSWAWQFAKELGE